MQNDDCIPCQYAKKNSKGLERQALIEKLQIKFKDEPYKTVALIQTKNYISWRDTDAEDIGRFKVLEYISFVQGASVEQIH